MNLYDLKDVELSQHTQKRTKGIVVPTDNVKDVNKIEVVLSEQEA